MNAIADQKTLTDIRAEIEPTPTTARPEASAAAPAAPPFAPPSSRPEPLRPPGQATPRVCSQCLAGPTGREFYVEQAEDKNRHKMMLCSHRCMALWATAKGWPK